VSTAASTGSASTGAASTGAASTGAAAFSWGDGWRQQLAAGSTDPGKESSHLERFESPAQIYKSYRELTRKVNDEFVPKLKPNATPEETAKWKADNGIPVKPEDYKITMPQGKEPPKEDDAFLATFRKSAHASNYSQAQFDSAVSMFYSEVERQVQTMGEAEKQAEVATDEKLRQEWGADYKLNKNMAEALLARAPQGFRDKFMNGYLNDRTPIKASTEAWKWLVQMEREINPAATVLPGQSGDLGKSIEAELKSLREMQKTNPKEYWKESNQTRERELLVAKEKLEKKAAAA
jgi:hypothetical protein